MSANASLESCVAELARLSECVARDHRFLSGHVNRQAKKDACSQERYEDLVSCVRGVETDLDLQLTPRVNRLDALMKRFSTDFNDVRVLLDFQRRTVVGVREMLAVLEKSVASWLRRDAVARRKPRRTFVMDVICSHCAGARN